MSSPREIGNPQERCGLARGGELETDAGGNVPLGQQITAGAEEQQANDDVDLLMRQGVQDIRGAA